MRANHRRLLVVMALLMSSYAVGQTPASGVTPTQHDGIVKGVVTSANGKRLKKIHVSLMNLQTEEKMETLTDRSGRFQFTRLFSGKYRLEVNTDKGETATDELSLGNGQTVTRKLIARQHG